MPELPDVENFKRYLDSTALHKKVSKTEVLEEQVLEGTTRQGLARELKGASFDDTRRHGKLMFVRVGEQGWLVLHFGMTGELDYAKENGLPDHTRVVFHFENGYRLAYTSQRMLGKVDFAENLGEYLEQEGLGADPLTEEFDLAYFMDVMKGRSGPIKSRLMDQSIIAGIGNVYADEILFQTGLRPDSETKHLTEADKKRVYRNVCKVMRMAVKRGADFSAFPRTWFLPHRDGDRKCPKCGGQIKDKKIGGRRSHFCDKCQEKK